MWDVVPPEFNTKGSSHICHIHTADLFPYKKRVLWFSAHYHYIHPLLQVVSLSSGFSVKLCMKLLVLFAEGHLAAAAVCGWTKDGAEGGVCFYAEAQTKDQTKCPDSMGDIRVSFCRI